VFAGRLLDHFAASGRGESAGYGILFGMCSTAYVIAFVVSHVIAPRFERVRLAAE
jgi:ACS family hexuronate transporter-like MFS transporter